MALNQESLPDWEELRQLDSEVTPHEPSKQQMSISASSILDVKFTCTSFVWLAHFTLSYSTLFQVYYCLLILLLQSLSSYHWQPPIHASVEVCLHHLSSLFEDLESWIQPWMVHAFLAYSQHVHYIRHSWHVLSLLRVHTLWSGASSHHVVDCEASLGHSQWLRFFSTQLDLIARSSLFSQKAAAIRNSTHAELTLVVSCMFGFWYSLYKANSCSGFRFVYVVTCALHRCWLHLFSMLFQIHHLRSLSLSTLSFTVNHQCAFWKQGSAQMCMAWYTAKYLLLRDLSLSWTHEQRLAGRWAFEKDKKRRASNSWRGEWGSCAWKCIEV